MYEYNSILVKISLCLVLILLKMVDCVPHIDRLQSCFTGKDRCCPSDLSFLEFDDYPAVVQTCLNANSCSQDSIELCQEMRPPLKIHEVTSVKQRTGLHAGSEMYWLDHCIFNCINMKFTYTQRCAKKCMLNHKEYKEIAESMIRAGDRLLPLQNIIFGFSYPG